ncbi:MAG: hypothetical protein WD851_21120 [Pirellulales bacterium]
MRGLLIIIALILILLLVGWITVSFTGDRASITLEKEKIKQDTQEISDSARDFTNKADKRIEGVVEDDAEPQPSNMLLK